MPNVFKATVSLQMLENEVKLKSNGIDRLFESRVLHRFKMLRIQQSIKNLLYAGNERRKTARVLPSAGGC